jgi:lipopolysaccharide export system protein LptA
MKKNNLLPVFAAILAILAASTAWALTSITAGDMEITSKLMTFHNNVYVARGGLKAIQKDSVLTADRGIYDRDLEIVKAIDNVEVVQPGSVLTSDYLEAYVNEDRILARGNPKLVRIVERESKDESGEASVKKTRVILTCNEVEGFNRENRFLAKGNVHVIEVPYRDGETEEEAAENEKSPVSDIKCETLELFSEEDKAIARNNVEIITETLRATGDKAIYLNKENRMIIVGHAHASQTSTDKASKSEQVSELYANKIIYYPEEDRTIAVGDVHATVYPSSGGQSGKKGKDKDKDKDKKKKKKDKKKTDKTDGISGSSPAVNSVEELPEGLPAGDYLKVTGEDSYIEATSDD